MRGQRAAQQLEPALAGHVDVAEHELEVVLSRLQQLARLIGAGRELAMKSVLLENARDQPQHLRFVIDDENMSTVGQRLRSPSVWRQRDARG